MRQRRKSIESGTFAAVIRAFMASDKVQKQVAPNTRILWTRFLAIAERPEVLGAVEVEEMRPSLVQAFLDGLADRPASQRNARKAMRALEKWALVRDMLAHPICTGTELVKHDAEGHEPWTDDQIAFAERNLPAHLARVITLAANTGQRGSDLIKMRWTDLEEFEGRQGINVTQKKTGVQIWIPFSHAFARTVSAWPRPSSDEMLRNPDLRFICLKAGRKPWTRNQLSSLWHKTRQDFPELATLHLHGLRGTACERLHLAGANDHQIANMVGMSVPMVARYTRKSDQRRKAISAVHYLDGRNSERTENGETKIIPLGKKN